MMKTEMTISTLKRVRVAGLLLLLSLTIPTLNWAFILSGFTSTEGHLSEMIASKEPLFRLNILIQVFGSILALSLGCVLHRILKDTSPTLSIFALLLKAIESGAILVLVVLLSVGLLILKAGGADSASFLAVIIDNYVELTSIAGILMGISMLIWMYLFLKSAYIPKAMVVSGMLVFAFVVVYDTLMLTCLNI
jgi:hypothetical protein